VHRVRRSFGPLTVAAAGLLLTAFAGYAAYAEFPAHFLTDDAPPAAWVAAAPGLSSEANDELLGRCLDGLVSPLALLQTTQKRLTTARACKSVARTIVYSSPASSYAWLVIASSSAVAGHWQEMNSAIEEAHKLASNEQWIAARRVVLAEQFYDHLSPAAKSNEGLDIELLLSGEEGRRMLVDRYLTQPTFRDRMTSVLDRLSVSEQTAFLNTLHEAIGPVVNG
jgi:hypothetical protein